MFIFGMAVLATVLAIGSIVAFFAAIGALETKEYAALVILILTMVLFLAGDITIIISGFVWILRILVNHS